MSAKVPAVVSLSKQALMENKCVVIGLRSTGEARTEDAVTKYASTRLDEDRSASNDNSRTQIMTSNSPIIRVKKVMMCVCVSFLINPWAFFCRIKIYMLFLTGLKLFCRIKIYKIIGSHNGVKICCRTKVVVELP